MPTRPIRVFGFTAPLTKNGLYDPRRAPRPYRTRRVFRVCEMTIRHWLAAGVDVLDPLAVARHLAHSKTPGRDAMSVLLEELNTDFA